MPSINDRLKHAWNAFLGRDAPDELYKDYGIGYASRPDRRRLWIGAERSIINAIYTRIAMDVAAVSIKHVRLDENKRYNGDIRSGLNECLTVEANKDQTGRAFIQDAVQSMFEEGVVAIVPTSASKNPLFNTSYDIFSMRTGKIVSWYPDYVRVELYNDEVGRREERVLPKRMVAIVQNPFYDVMNEPNSTLQRLIHKLSLLDAVDEQSSSGKLDLIIQLPYVIKTEARRLEAEKRRKEIESQLSGTKYGIAYTDGTEHITQLNRSIENNLMKQIEFLTDMLYSQLGLTPEVFNGTADEKVMLNYTNRTLEPILAAFADEMNRKFLTQTARTQGQSIKFFNDPFKLVPAADLAEIGDKYTRNAIMSSNEIRQIVGLMPSDEPDADALRNKNLNLSAQEQEQQQNNQNESSEEKTEMNLA